MRDAVDSAKYAGLVALLSGAALMVLAVAADTVRGAPFRFGPGQLAVTVVGAVLAIAGALWMLSRRFGDNLRRVAGQIGAGWRAVAGWTFAAAVLFASIELAMLVLAGRTAIPIHHDAAWRRVPYYATQDWAEAYWDELSRLEMRYEPILLWRSMTFAGSWIQVDAAGVRRTPGASAAPDAVRVFAFGGSAMWGTGAPDHGTIPAYLQRRLTDALGRPVEVVNLAEKGYVSTQNLLRLILELRAGRVPDLAIFYDGFNDVGAGSAGDFGGHYQRQRIAGRLEQPLRTWLLTSRTASLVQLLARRRPDLGPMDPEQRSLLTAGIVEAYSANCRMVEALSREYGFRYRFFWQPALVAGAKPLTPGEEAIRDETMPELGKLLRQVYGRIAQEAAGRRDLHDLAGVLDQESAHLYVDDVHLTPRGNEIVAAAMVEILAPVLQPAPDDR